MSVVGFDFGNESCIVGVARQRGIDVVLNNESKCETPAIICLGDKQRFISTVGAASSMMNPKNTVSQIKRIIGHKFSDPDLQRDLRSLHFSVTEGLDGFPLIHARYLDEPRTFTPTHLLGMVLSDLKIIAEKNLSTAVINCCIGIPVYFTDLQRRAVMDAVAIMGLHPLRLFHEMTATALAYGIYKTDLPENGQLNVTFLDVGHASLQVCIAGYRKGQLKKALLDAGLSVENIHSVEVVGSGSHVPAIIKILTEFSEKEPRRTMNASECIARGCALQCAILSPTFKVREFQVNESFPFPIALSWKPSAFESQTGAVDNQQSSIVFPKGNPIPSIKALTFYRSSTFPIDVMYADPSSLRLSTPSFGTMSVPAFGSTSTPTFGSISTPLFGSTGSTFGVSSTPTFGSTTTSAFGAPSSPLFGSSSTPAFGASRTPAFGSPNTTAFGASSTSSSSFDSTPS